MHNSQQLNQEQPAVMALKDNEFAFVLGKLQLRNFPQLLPPPQGPHSQCYLEIRATHVCVRRR